MPFKLPVIVGKCPRLSRLIYENNFNIRTLILYNSAKKRSGADHNLYAPLLGPDNRWVGIQPPVPGPRPPVSTLRKYLTNSPPAQDRFKNSREIGAVVAGVACHGC